MGAAMAARIQSAGYHLTIFARNPSKPLPLSLTQSGAHLASSPADLARSSHVLFTMVSHPSDVRSLLLHPDTGALSALPEGAAVVDTTSSSPDLAVQIAYAARSRNCHAVDAPVSGGDVGARDGKLAIFAGADDEAVVRWLSPLFEILGKVTYMGPPGSGQSAKIGNQIAVSGSLLGLSEALFFAEKSGLDVKDFLDAVRGGGAGSKATELFGERIVRRDLRPGGFAEYLVKDLGMALKAPDPVAADDDDETNTNSGTALALPGTALFQQLYLAMVANGDGKLGSHGLISVTERINSAAAVAKKSHQDHH